MGARLGEGAACGEPALEIDDVAQGREPAGRLAYLPPRKIAEADLEDVEIERRIEVVAERPFAGKVVDPSGDAPGVVDSVIERPGHAGLVGAGFDLIAGVEIDQRLVEDRLSRAGLGGGRERARRGVAVR